MSVSRRGPLLLLAAAVAFARPSLAQTTEERLKDAIEKYNAFNIEGARPILLNVVSPNYIFPITTEQKVRAYKYLGASYAVLDRRDSAVVFFSAAIDFDPFTDLDPREFSAAELAAFGEAKSRVFKVALRPIVPARLDTNFSFRLITTQRANLTVDIVKQSDTTQKEILFQSDNDGPRDVRWNGFLRNGQRADSTLYEVRAIARRGNNPEVIDRQLFKLEHVFEPLEDTLPSIPTSDLLPEQYKSSAPWFDLIKGGALATVAVGLPYIAFGSDFERLDWRPHAGAAVGVALASSIISFSYRRGHREIPANVRENTRRKQQRELFNSGVRTRNQDRIARTIMLICPATGCPR